MANQPSPWQRLRDNFVMSAVHSPLGGGGLARAYYKYKGYSDAQINEAIRKLDNDFDKKYSKAPVIQGKGFNRFSPDNIGRATVGMVGSLLGSVDPTFAVAPGRSAAQRIVGQSAVQGASSAVRQRVEKNTGQRKEMSGKEVLKDMAMGAAFQGGMEAAGKVLRGRRPEPTIQTDEAGNHIAPDGMPAGNEGGVRPMDPHEIARIMGDPEAAGGAPLQRRANRDAPNELYTHPSDKLPANDATDYSRMTDEELGYSPPKEVPVHEVLTTDEQNNILDSLPPANREWLEQQAGNNVVPFEPQTTVEGPLPSKGKLAPAIKLENKIYSSPENTTHYDVLTQHKLEDALDNRENFLNDGFIDPEGNFLDRKQAKDWLAKQGINVEPTYPGTETHLDAADYRDQILDNPAIDDAAVETPPSLNNARDAMDIASTNAPPPAPANDKNMLDAAKGKLKEIFNDEEGSLNPWGRKGYEDDTGKVYEDTPAGRLAKAIDEAAPLRDKQDRLNSQERAKRFSEVAKRQSYVEGEEGLYSQLAAMKGPLPKVEFEPVVHGMDPAEVKSLYTQIWRHPRLNTSEKLSAGTGLKKILGEQGGGVPQEAELHALRTVFGDQLVESVAKKQSMTGMDIAGNLLNMPRALKSTLDLSAPLRQGAPLIYRKEYWTSFRDMFKQAGSEKAYQAVKNEIMSRPSYRMMKEAGLALSDQGKNLADREEKFMSNWAEHIPVAGKLVRASDRAYTGFLNKLRADTFDSLVREAQAAGIDFKNNPKALKDIAKYINTSTGRGSLEGLVPGGNASAPLLAGAFFSPRLMASRINMLNPIYYKRLDPFARTQAIKSLVAYGGIITTVLGLAKMSGAEVETDPRSTDFAKIKVGDNRYDITGGFNTYLRFAAQMVTGQKVTPDGDVKTLGGGIDFKNGIPVGWHNSDEVEKGPYAQTRKTAIANFLANKENPVLSAFMTIMNNGKNEIGEDVSALQQAVDALAPMIAADTWEVYKDMGPKEAAKTVLPNLFGVGVQNMKPKEKEEKEPNFTKDDFKNTDFSEDFEDIK